MTWCVNLWIWTQYLEVVSHGWVGRAIIFLHLLLGCATAWMLLCRGTPQVPFQLAVYWDPQSPQVALGSRAAPQGLFLHKGKILHLSMLNFMRILQACFSSPSASPWVATLPSSTSTGSPCLVSSQLDKSALCHLLLVIDKMINRTGPKTRPVVLRLLPGYRYNTTNHCPPHTQVLNWTFYIRKHPNFFIQSIVHA